MTAEEYPRLKQAMEGLKCGLDWADALHLASCSDCEAIVSFNDRRFARQIRHQNLHPHILVPTQP